MHKVDEAHIAGSINNGIYSYGNARLIDRSCAKRLPIGDSSFEWAIAHSVVIDKTMLIADILDSGYKAMLFCRPRRFGKTFNMSMLKSFFEVGPGESPASGSIFEGTHIWEARDGAYRAHLEAYPVVSLSLRAAKGMDWDAAFGAIGGAIADEYNRHDYLLDGDCLNLMERDYFMRIGGRKASTSDLVASLVSLTRFLARYHERNAVLLIDEYDAPVMAGYTAPNGGYYSEVVAFLKSWLTAALKDNDALAFACMTGVQRISKESIFSDLNNLLVSTALSDDSDERFGFTRDEVEALAEYMGYPGCVQEAEEWYDGYHFGSVDVFNPWSILNYFYRDCTAGVYWLNTSSNEVVGEAIRHADERTLREMYTLAEEGGTVVEPLDLGVIFPDVGVRREAVWSMLYLSGYLTTDDTEMPDDPWRERALRIPNREIARLFTKEIPLRFAQSPEGGRNVRDFHRALREGDAGELERVLGMLVAESVSYFDLTSENSAHMMLLGLCFGIEGYAGPRSNREAGSGRFDIQIHPEDVSGVPPVRGKRPIITIEVKFSKDANVSDGELRNLAEVALGQIESKGYDSGCANDTSDGCARWGIAFQGKRVAAVCETLQMLH